MIGLKEKAFPPLYPLPKGGDVWIALRNLPGYAFSMSTPSCKICGAPSTFFAKVDFHANAQLHFGYYDLPINPSGLMLDYYRCHACGFLFTPFMDDWTPQKFGEMIYNQDYPQVDGTYNGYRGGTFANILALAFHGKLPQLQFLDYGGGLGIQAELLRVFGAKRSESYDPYAVGRNRPAGTFNVVTCMEVVEHSTNPKQTIADIVKFAADDGLIMFTTEAPPADIEQQKEKWWYITPRVGHVSFYSFDALDRLFNPYGYKLAHIETHTHFAYRTWPAWADKLLPPHIKLA